MRPVVSTSMFAGMVLLVACAAPPIDSALETDDGVKLPDRTTAATVDGGGSGDAGSGSSSDSFTLTVTLTGSGTGTVGSMPDGVTCAGTTCVGSFARGTRVTLTPAPTAGTVFAGWSSPCTGNPTCSVTIDGDVTVGAQLELLDGTWSGTYTNTRVANGCTFNNAGKLEVTAKASATAPTQSATVAGLELRNIPGCQLVGSTAGAAPSAPVMLAGSTVTGTWTFSVQGAGGTLAFPFTGKITGKTMTGSWTCPTCTGSFTLSKP